MSKSLIKNNKFDSLKLTSVTDAIDKEIAALSVNGGIYVEKGIRIGESNSEIAGLMRFTNGSFEGYDGNTWIPLSDSDRVSHLVEETRQTSNTNSRYNYFGILDEQTIEMVESGTDPSNQSNSDNVWNTGNIFSMLVKKDERKGYNDLLNGHILIYDGFDWSDMGSLTPEPIGREEIVSFTKQYLDNKFKHFAETQFIEVQKYCVKVIDRFVDVAKHDNMSSRTLEKHVKSNIDISIEDFYPLDSYSFLLGDLGGYNIEVCANFVIRSEIIEGGEDNDSVEDTVEIKLLYGYGSKDSGPIELKDCVILEQQEIKCIKETDSIRAINWSGKIENEQPANLKNIWIEAWIKRTKSSTILTILPEISSYRVKY